MTYPACFYHQEVRGGKLYETRATGKPDIPRLVHGHADYWISKSTSREPTPKKLILSDWSALAWTDEKIQATQTALAKLIDDGFEVYLWQKGQLEPLKKNKLTCLEDINVRHNMRPPDDMSDLSRAAATQYKIAQDKIQLLDDYWLNHLLSASEIPMTRSINLHDFSIFFSSNWHQPMLVETLLANLKNSTPAPSVLIVNDFTCDALDPIQLLTDKFNGITMVKDPQYVDLFQKRMVPIKCGDVELTLSDLNLIQEVSFYGFEVIPLSHLEKLFGEDSRLETLVMRYVETNVNLSSVLSNKPANSMPHLKNAKFVESMLTKEDVIALLNAASNLKKLDIFAHRENSDLLLEPIFSLMKDGSLNHLTEITFSSMKITSLQPLFKVAPHIKQLRLSDCKTSANIFANVPANSLPNLEGLCLENDSLNQETLSCLLMAATNLKNIDLHRCTLGTTFITLPKNHLIQLKQVKLFSSSMSLNDLKSLFAAAPNLTDLDFELLVGDCSKEDYEALISTVPTLKKFPTFEKVSMTAKSAFIEQPPVSALPTGSQSKKTHSPTTSESMDADTELKITTFQLNRIFYSMGAQPNPAPYDYRLDTFQVTEINPALCDISKAFTMKKTGDLQLKLCDIRHSLTDVYATPIAEGAKCYYGKQTLRLNREWQSLASLSSQEKLLRYHTDPDVKIEIQYSLRDNLYYVRSATEQTQTIDIDFVVSIPTPTPIPADIKALTTHFSNYSPGALAIKKSKDSLTGNDYLEALLTQKKGACRHRAFAFKHWMETNHSEIPVRIITNDCHAFVEVYADGHWHQCDLGGYPAALVINESNKPNKTDQDSAVIHTVLHTAPSAPQEAVPNDDFNNYLRDLSTWIPSLSKAKMPKDYYQQSVGPVKHDGTDAPVKNRLIRCASTEDADALHYALQDHCKIAKRPVFYVNSPEDLMCPISNMHYNADGTGELKRERNSLLYQFLTNQQNANGVVVVNYSEFKPDDFVRFNALLDTKRSADGVDIPESMLIVGLLSPSSQNPAPGRDFFSRFDEVEVCPLDPQSLKDSLPRLNDVMPLDHMPSPLIINLYHADDWKERLLGRWVPKNGAWMYEKGALTLALEKDPPAEVIEIQNGLWENKEFCRFWREARQTGVIQHDAGSIYLLERTSIVPRDKFNWEILKRGFQQEPKPSLELPLVLNSATFANFFSQYDITDDNQMNQTIGYLEEAKERGDDCFVHLTRSLSNNEWAMLLDECQKHGVKLHTYCAPGVELPEELQKVGFQPTVESREKMLVSTILVQSTDVDTTVAMLEKTYPKALIIDVSECDDSDLLWKTKGAVIDEQGQPLRFEFSKTKCAVLKALEAGQTVLLKGRCSSALADQLATLLLTRQRDPNVTGRLLLVSADTKAFNYLPSQQHTVTVGEKKTVLRDRVGDIPAIITDKQLSEEPLSTLEARCRFIKRNPLASSDQLWAGLEYFPDAVNDPGALSIADAEQAAAVFTKGRLDEVHAVLKQEPYVYLTGLSGVGKSTFVSDELCKDGAKLYREKAGLLAFATDKTPNQTKYLFFDEANLDPEEWSTFEGLFNKAPSLLIDGQYYPLTKDHKVIFAGNPLSYGDERKLAPFFARHGNAVVFKPLPTNMLYAKILMPVFKDTLLEPHAVKINTHLLEIYRFLCTCSETDVLISPRELQMIALLTLSHCRAQDSEEEILAIARAFAHQITKPLVPAAKQTQFNQLFPPIALPDRIQKSSKEYLITPSRKDVSALLDNFLALREARRDPSSNKEQAYGGLGGILLDGEPGIGKSELVLNALLANGYTKQNLEHPVAVDKPFYHMPVSMSLDDKHSLLRKAFDQGAVVLIDEINSAPMMEQLLNALLMGKTPEGALPTHPGFMIIGTQNPISMAGRRAASTALARRTITVELPPYTLSEMHDILLEINVPEEKAIDMTHAYKTQTDYAKAHDLTPAPTFRDLMRTAKHAVHGAVVKQQIQPIVPLEQVQQLTKSQIDAINKRLVSINKQLDSCWPYRDREAKSIPNLAMEKSALEAALVISTTPPPNHREAYLAWIHFYKFSDQLDQSFITPELSESLKSKATEILSLPTTDGSPRPNDPNLAEFIRFSTTQGNEACLEKYLDLLMSEHPASLDLIKSSHQIGGVKAMTNTLSLCALSDEERAKTYVRFLEGNMPDMAKRYCKQKNHASFINDIKSECLGYLEEIKNAALGDRNVDPKTADYYASMQEKINRIDSKDALLYIPILDGIKKALAAVSSPDMNLVRTEITRLKKAANCWLSYGNNNRAMKIIQAICKLDLLERLIIFPNQDRVFEAINQIKSTKIPSAIETQNEFKHS